MRRELEESEAEMLNPVIGEAELLVGGFVIGVVELWLWWKRRKRGR
jgi:hypothetical protein